MSSSLRIVGPGRAGGSLAAAAVTAGWDVRPVVGRDGDIAGAARGVDLLVLATPDAAIAEVAAAVEPVASTVVAHLAGSLGPDVLLPHPRRAALHPLVSLPSPGVGAARLTAGAWFALAGDPLAAQLVADLGGRAFTVADADSAAYHAAAAIASNHVVALLGQVERIAASVGVPFEAYVELARATIENVADLGPARALTGPAARGDGATIERHLAALAPQDRPSYEALAELARRLATTGGS